MLLILLIISALRAVNEDVNEKAEFLLFTQIC